MVARKRITAWIHFLIWIILLGFSVSCSNNPYPREERKAAIHYDSFHEEPKHLDPAISYSSDQWQFIALIYEPILQYHFLKRPYELEPLTATSLPKPQRTARGIEYVIEIKKGIYFAEHPAFLKDENGQYLWHSNGLTEFPKVDHPLELLQTKRSLEVKAINQPFARRELKADDYIYQIKRLAHPQLQCPIAQVLNKYILGFEDLGKQLGKEVEQLRKQRKAAAGIFYNPQRNEKQDPLYIDLRKFEITGVEKIDDYRYKIILSREYPQLLYWLAMPFFAPMAPEVDKFFLQPAAAKLNFNLDRFPAGTGPYILSKNQANFRMELTKNPHYHDDFYPSVGEAEDEAKGLLHDRGKKLPFLDKVVFNYEKEALPQWIKFQQGYYDTSGILEENFDKVMDFSKGEGSLSSELSEKGITLNVEVSPTIFFFAFNLEDPVFGGYSENKRLLRRAISIALNADEFLQIFTNGRGKLAHGPLPEGIFGNIDDINQYIYTQKGAKAVQHGIERAKQLLADAGYRNGIDQIDKKQLVLYFDTYWDGPVAKSRFDLYRKQLSRIGVDFQIRKTDYNQFQNKVNKGNFQFIFWGWHADYPDPENFFFLLYGPNSKKRSGGENHANYDNPRFNELFRIMENMTNSPQRQAIIQQMLEILRQDAPWHFYFFPESYGLYHSWYKNAKPMTIGNNALKYKRIDFTERQKKRIEWNKPSLWPLFLIMTVIIVGIWKTRQFIQKRKRLAVVNSQFHKEVL